MNKTTKVALVTGAARGIGLATAQWFLEHGHAVGVLDIDRLALEAASTALARPDAVLALPADVRDAAQVAGAVAALVQRFGRLDALVNNAGIAVFKPVLDTTLDEWTQVLATNLTGPFICTQAGGAVDAARSAAAASSTSRRSPACAPARCAWPTAPARPR